MAQATLQSPIEPFKLDRDLKQIPWETNGHQLLIKDTSYEGSALSENQRVHGNNDWQYFGESLNTQPNKLTSSPAARLNYPCGLKPDQDEQQVFEYIVKPNHRLKTTGLRHTTESDTKQQTAKVFSNLVHLNSQPRSTIW